MKTLDQSLREVLREQTKALSFSQKGPCPDEELLGLFAEGKLSGSEKDRVQDHLGLCSDCLEIMLMITSCDEEQVMEQVSQVVPAGFIKKAKDLVGPGVDKMFFDLIVHCSREGLEVIHSGLKALSPICRPEALALRSAGEATSSEPLRMEKIFKHIVAELELNSSGQGAWTVQVFLKKAKQEVLPDGLRVTLKSRRQKKELHSLIARKGLAIFQDLPCGEYFVEIKDKGAVVGELSLCLSES